MGTKKTIAALVVFFLVGGFLGSFIDKRIFAQEKSSRVEKQDPTARLTPSAPVPPAAALVAEPQPSKTAGEERRDGHSRRVTQDQRQDLLDVSLDMINEADSLWLKGDIEAALEILDQVYALVLTTNGNADILRQKDDLRLLISRRLLAIYSTSNLPETRGRSSQIPLILNNDVEREIRSFQTVERNFFINSYRRSAIFLPTILRELQKAGLPPELAWLPLVESGFKINALSPARALGLWQFIPSTGYKYGLTRNEWLDERMDVEKATRAAIAYLSDLHAMFGDWLTALAAYNCGEGRILRVLANQRINYFDRFWDLYHQLPYETARYVPRFLATLHIVNDPKKFGFDLPASPTDEGRPVYAYEYETVKVNRVMRLEDIASHTGTSEALLTILNAELRHKLTPDFPYELKLPREAVEKFSAVQNDIPQWQKKARKVIRHRVRRGENIESIARQYNVSPRLIRENNRALVRRGVAAGQLIRIPIRMNDVLVPVQTAAAEVAGKAVEEAGRPETLAGENAPQAAEDRTLPPNRARRAIAEEGARKEAPARERERQQAATYIVKPNDTLLSVARRHGLTLGEIKRFNNLRTDVIRVGQTLRVLPPPTKAVAVESTPRAVKAPGAPSQTAKREVSPRPEIRKASVSSEQPRGPSRYVVRPGDNLHLIARKFDTSVAALIRANQLRDGDHIEAGQTLVIR